MTAGLTTAPDRNQAIADHRRGLGARLLIALGRLWKILAAVALCLNPVTGLIAYGWLTRFAGRAVYRAWFRASPLAKAGMTFEGYAAGEPALVARAGWPNWILRQDWRARLSTDWPLTAGRARWLVLPARTAFEALWQNAKAGIGTLIVVAVWTFPVAALWLFAWWAGWENSFNKGYEQHWVGPVLALAGIAIFVLVMRLLPLAMARFGATGAIRSAFAINYLRRLLRAAPLRGLQIACLYAAAALPLFALKGIPVFVEQVYPGFTALNAEQAAVFAQNYWIGATVYLVLALLVVRGGVAAIYARMTLAGLRKGHIGAGDLSEPEREVLTSIRLLGGAERDDRSALAKAARWAGRRALRVTVGTATIGLWFAVAALVFVGQFLNHDWIQWANHPLIHLPVLRF